MTPVTEIAQRAKRASQLLRSISGKAREQALNRMADKLLAYHDDVIAANDADLAAAPDLTPAFQKRLKVSEKIFDYMLNRLREAAALPDPVGKILEGHTMPSGLQVRKIAVPIGVIAMIYEARPNVTTDAAAVAIKSGNAVILKGVSATAQTLSPLVNPQSVYISAYIN